MKRSTQIKIILNEGALILHWILEAEHLTAVFRVMLYRFEKDGYGGGNCKRLPAGELLTPKALNEILDLFDQTRNTFLLQGELQGFKTKKE